MARMQSPIRPSTPGAQDDRPSRTDRLRSFVRNKSRTPSPSKTRAQEAISHAKPMQFPPNMVTPQAFMLPPDHPHANLVLGDVNNNRRSPERAAHGSPRRADSVELKQCRRPSNAQQSPPKRRAHETTLADKENYVPSTPSHVTSPTPIWAQFASPQNGHRVDSFRQDQEAINNFKPVGASLEYGSTCVGSPLQHIKTSTGRPFTVQGRSTIGSITSASSIEDGTAALSKSSLPSFVGRNGSMGDLQGEEFDAAFEAVLAARHIPEQRRENLRRMDVKVKREFIRHGSTDKVAQATEEQKSSFWSFGKTKSEKSGRGRSSTRDAQDGEFREPKSPSKRDMSRGRTAEKEKSRADRSPSKKPRSLSRPRSLMSLKNLSSSSLHTLGFDGAKDSKEQSSSTSTTGEPRSPEDFVDYLRSVQDPVLVEVGKMHKLRTLLRNESIIWIDTFVQEEGVDGMLGLLDRIMKIEWREEHEDLLLHEVLLCLKGLSTTHAGLDKLLQVESTLFPCLLKALFDEKDKKGPSEYSDRKIIIDLLYAQLVAAPSAELAHRARSILGRLSDQGAPDDDQPLDFITQMHQSRPYTNWCREIVNVSKEVFWIFMHHSNVITAEPALQDGRPYHKRHFPPPQPPVPAAPHVGGVEFDATRYIFAHLELMNGLIASLSTAVERNKLRDELRASGFERLMGGRLRLCREKYYGVIHDGIRTWLAAAMEDGWKTADVSYGPVKPESAGVVGTENMAPKLELPKLDLNVNAGNLNGNADDGWI